MHQPAAHLPETPSAHHYYHLQAEQSLSLRRRQELGLSNARRRQHITTIVAAAAAADVALRTRRRVARLPLQVDDRRILSQVDRHRPRDGRVKGTAAAVAVGGVHGGGIGPRHGCREHFRPAAVHRIELAGHQSSDKAGNTIGLKEVELAVDKLVKSAHPQGEEDTPLGQVDTSSGRGGLTTIVRWIHRQGEEEDR